MAWGGAKHRVHLSNLLIEHLRISALITLAHHKIADRMRRRGAALLRLSDNEHRERHGIRREAEQFANLFLALDDVADIAAAEAHGLRRDGRILSRDHSILCRNGKFA